MVSQAVDSSVVTKTNETKPPLPVDAGVFNCPSCGHAISKDLSCSNLKCQADWSVYAPLVATYPDNRVINHFLFFTDVRAAILPPLGTPITPITESLIQTARLNQQNGRYILLGGDDIEDLNAQLNVVRTPNGAERAILFMKVRADLPFSTTQFSSGDAKVLASLNHQEPKYQQVIQKKNKKGVLPYDAEHQIGASLMEAAKSLSFHFSTPEKDGVLKPKVEEYMESAKAALAKLAGSKSMTKSEQEMLAYYQSVLVDLDGCLKGAKSQDKTQWKKPQHVELYQGQYEYEQVIQQALPPDQSGNGLPSMNVKGILPINAKNELESLDELKQVSFQSKAIKIVLDEERGWYAFYYPHAKDVSFTQRGSLFIVSPETLLVDVNLVVEAIFRMRQLNLTATLASVADAEYLYLARNAWAMGLTKTTKFKQIMSWSDEEGNEALQKAMELAEKIDLKLLGVEIDPAMVAQSLLIRAYQIVKLKRRMALRELIAEHLNIKVQEMTKSPAYLQFMECLAVKDGMGLQAGTVSWTRLDASQPAMEKVLADVYIQHEVKGHDGNMTTLDNLLNIIQGGGILWCTFKRSNMGIYAGHTMSPVEDMDTGGAGYLFGFIRNSAKTSSVSLIWEAKTVASRSDIYFYPGDHFGAINSENSKYEAATLSTDLIKLAKYIGGEIMLKNAISIYSMPPRWIVTGSDAGRSKVLAAFKNMGVTHIGVHPIEDVVVASSAPKKPSKGAW